MKYLPRDIEGTVKRFLSIFPAVAITGPRQSGKSTMLQQVFGRKFKYVTFDDPAEIEFFLADPKGFFNQYKGRLILDEVQKVPEVFNYLKMLIDKDRGNYGKFILTGSSQFSFIKSITETLAGRIGMLSLLPFQRQEIPLSLRKKQILFGSYPELLIRNYRNVRQWYGAYLQNYLERDVRSLSNIGNIRDFQRLISLLAARTAQELNLSSLSRELGINVKTVQNWISILEASYVVFLIAPYHNNLGKRIVKRPKIYFYDTGLICYLTGIRDFELLDKGPLQGEIFENYVVAEILKAKFNYDRDLSIYYFRDNLGSEVDLIIDDKEKKNITYLEIKKSQTFKIKMAQQIKKLIEKEKKYNKTVKGIVLYDGKQSGEVFNGIGYMNYSNFLEKFNK